MVPTGLGRWLLAFDPGSETVRIAQARPLEKKATLNAPVGITALYSAWFDTVAVAPAGRKAVIFDLEGAKKIAEIDLDSAAGPGAMTPDGRKLFLPLEDAGEVAIIDAQIKKLKATIAVGGRPHRRRYGWRLCASVIEGEGIMRTEQYEGTPKPRRSRRTPSGDAGLKKKVVRKARDLGAALVGVAPVSRWDEAGEVPPDYRPTAIWAQTQSVIVVAVPMLLPIIESTPSINYQEMYDTSNRLLDEISFRLASWLTEQGQASVSMPRDGYAKLEVLLTNPFASFSHTYAAKYAGLGTVGLLAQFSGAEFGPACGSIRC